MNPAHIEFPSGIDPSIFLAVAMSAEEKYEGAPGVVWIHGQSAKFVTLAEIELPELKAGLEKMHEDEADDVYFFVHQMDSRVHVFKFPKADAAASLSRAIAGSKGFS